MQANYKSKSRRKVKRKRLEKLRKELQAIFMREQLGASLAFSARKLDNHVILFNKYRKEPINIFRRMMESVCG
jgi:hypothetical protein